MANIAHGSITDPNLHEPKGATTATAGQVYVANGGGSGTWQLLAAASMAATGNPLGSGMLHLQNQQASGTNGASIPGSTWTTRVLNTTIVNQVGASLASNQMTLVAGTYVLDAMVTYFNANQSTNRLRLFNVTGAAVLFYGLSYSNGPSEYGTVSLRGRFTLGGTTAVAIQHYMAGSGLEGTGTSLGTEVYADVMLWKVA